MLTGVSLAAFVGIFSNVFFASLSDGSAAAAFTCWRRILPHFSFPFFWM
jgi:hypothetical protein